MDGKKFVVKTWCENTKEGEEYLKFNGYKNAKRIGQSDLYEVECIGSPLRDVEIVDTNTSKPLSEIIQSASNRAAELQLSAQTPAKDVKAKNVDHTFDK